MDANDLTSLSWLHNLNIMDKLSAAVTAPPTPPASPQPHPSTSPLIRTVIKLEPGTSNHHSSRKRPASSSAAGRQTVIASSSVASVTTEQSASAAIDSIKEEIDYKICGDVKPPYSYASLICMAMRTNQHKMTLSSIYKWIKENFLYYRNADPSWQVSRQIINFKFSFVMIFIYFDIDRNRNEEKWLNY